MPTPTDPTERKCYCSWGDDCAYFSKEIRRLAPLDHVWNRPDVLIQLVPSKVTDKLTLHSLAMLRGLEKHFMPRSNLDRAEMKKSMLYIAPHHFPRSLLLWKQEKGRPKAYSYILSRADVKAMEFGDGGRGRMGEDCNSVAQLCRERFSENDFVQSHGGRRYDYRRCYPQTPMENRSDVKSFVVNLLNRKAGGRPIQPLPRIVSVSNAGKKECTSPPGVRNKEDPAILSANHHPFSPAATGSTKIVSLKEKPPRKFDPSSLCSPLPSCENGMSELYAEFLAASTFHPSLAESLRKTYDTKKSADAWDNVSRCFNSFHGPYIKRVLTMITGGHGSLGGFKIGERVFFHPCFGLGSLTLGSLNSVALPCELFTLRALKWEGRIVLCGNCRQLKQNSESNSSRTEKRHEQDGGDLDRTPTLKCLNVQGMHALCTKQRVQNRNLKRRVNRYLSRLKSYKKRLVLPQGSSVRDLLAEACSYVKTNLNTSKDDLMKAFIDLQLDSDKENAGVDLEHKRECVESIVSSILNMEATLRGNTSQCRYPAHLVNTALSLFMRNRKAYDDFRASGVLCLPSPRKLRQIATKLRSREGGDPSIYSVLQNEIASMPGQNEMTGQLLLDEIKLKNGVAFNSNSNEIVGFVEGSLDLRELYRQILVVPESSNDNGISSPEGKNADGKKEVTVYANQWRFRSTRGVVHNGDYYFNDGSLTGNEIMRQFLQVLASYELIGCRIHGIVCDAGGGNAGFLKLLRKGCKVGAPWAGRECVTFKNPLEPTRDIAMWTCSTHGLKAARNALFKSQHKMVRNFICDRVSFGWKPVRECFQRDEARELVPGLKGRSGIVRHAVFLDKYTVMNCKYAKMPFSERAISEMLSHAAIKVGVTLDAVGHFPSQWHKFSCLCKQLKDAYGNKDEDTKGLVHCLEFQIAIHGIFIERLLNSKWKLTQSTIESERELLKGAVAYFCHWHSQKDELQELLEHKSKKETSLHFLADQTFENLLLTVSGFLSYAELILAIDPNKEVAYVPGLHSNQSSIEAFFSRIRQLGKDRVDKYGGGVTQQNVLNTVAAESSRSRKRRKVGNSMYPSEIIATENEPMAARTLGDDIKHQAAEAKLKEIMKSAKSTIPSAGGTATVLSSSFKHNGSAFGYILADVLSSMSVDTGMESDVSCHNFRDVLLQDDIFCDYFVLSARTSHYRWFQYVLSNGGSDKLDTLCQDMTGIVFHLVETSLEVPASRLESSFEYNFLSFLQSEGLSSHTAKYEEAEGGVGAKLCYSILFDLIKRKIFNFWLPQAIKRYRHNIQQRGERTTDCEAAGGETTTNSETSNDNVNRFAGWALCKAIKKHKLTMGGDDEDNDETAEEQEERHFETGIFDAKAVEVTKILTDMKVVQSQILGDAEYISRFYPLDDAIRDKGSLTLITPLYIKPLSKLTSYIDSNLTMQDLKTHATDGKLKEVFLKRMQDNGIMEHVNSIVAISEQQVPTEYISTEERRSILMEMVGPMLNAQVGYLLKQYRSKHLTRVNDVVTFRGQLSVTTKKKKVKQENCEEDIHFEE